MFLVSTHFPGLDLNLLTSALTAVHLSHLQRTERERESALELTKWYRVSALRRLRVQVCSVAGEKVKANHPGVCVVSKAAERERIFSCVSRLSDSLSGPHAAHRTRPVYC